MLRVEDDLVVSSVVEVKEFVTARDQDVRYLYFGNQAALHKKLFGQKPAVLGVFIVSEVSIEDSYCCGG
jgi:hypothetical protein